MSERILGGLYYRKVGYLQLWCLLAWLLDLRTAACLHPIQLDTGVMKQATQLTNGDGLDDIAYL